MNLDNKKLYEKLDTHQVAESIDSLADQIRQVIQDSSGVKIPKEYSKVKNIVLAGMGGSNLGIRILRKAFSDQIGVPININAGYGVPSYVDKDTLYILSSYSGTTEEPLSTYQEVKKRKAKVIAITKDDKKSKLKKIMIKDSVPGYMFSDDQNPSLQPRLGLGYSIYGIAILLDKAGIIKLDYKLADRLVEMLEKNNKKLSLSSPSTRNIAKKSAALLKGRMPILVAAEHLSGNLHVLRNQLNESSKTYASYLVLPDLNHFAMEGLVNPAINKKALSFVFFDSDLYSARIKKRLKLSMQVVKKNGVELKVIKLNEKSKKFQCFEMLQLGTWLSYYLGCSYKVDPVAIPWVDWFKKQLK